jgi:ATP-binding cassette subfamily F protein 3
VIALRGVHKAYGDNVVYDGLDFEVERGERIALVGPNGAGKSTLLRILAGVLPFDSGERALGTHATVHYYAQHQLDTLDPARTALEEMEAVAVELGHTRLRTILGAFLFSGDDVDKRVAVLSGGEKARLALARMLVRPAALLAVDEPTNHLDLASREVLEGALAEFPGTIVFISHDRYFINRIATRVVEIERGRLTSHLGTYDDYLATKARSADAQPDAEKAPRRRPDGPRANDREDPRRIPASRRTPESEKAPLAAPPRKTSEIRKLQKRLEEVERRIAELEGRLEALAAMLAAPDLYRDAGRARAAVSEQKDAQAEVAWLLREWEELSTELGSHA